MMTAPLDRLNRPTPASLWWNIAAFVGATVILNGLIFGLGWNTSTDSVSAPRASFAPPDWVVGAVWTLILFPLMAAARWRFNSVTTAAGFLARRWTTFLLMMCLIWPFYSLAIGSLIGGLIGNIGVGLVAVLTVARCWKLDRTAALMVLPVVGWLMFATLLVSAQLGWF